jgi:hypothetical protein
MWRVYWTDRVIENVVLLSLKERKVSCISVRLRRENLRLLHCGWTAFWMGNLVDWMFTGQSAA